MRMISTKAIRSSSNLVPVTISILTVLLITSKLMLSHVTTIIITFSIEPLNKTGEGAFKAGETMTVISRNNGWLTVDPET
jgi:hypothetical protein